MANELLFRLEVFPNSSVIDYLLGDDERRMFSPSKASRDNHDSINRQTKE